jgi:hypothetical protein
MWTRERDTLEALHRTLPDHPDTRTVQTIASHPDGVGTHLIFTAPEDVHVANREFGTGIDIPMA